MPAAPGAIPANVQNAFNIWDTAGTGMIDARGLREALGMLGLDSTVSSAEIGSLYPDEKERLDVRAFNRVVQRLHDLQEKGKPPVPDEARQAFAKCDSVGLGVLDAAGLRRALGALGFATDYPAATRELLRAAEAGSDRFTLLEFHDLAPHPVLKTGPAPA